MNRLPHRLSSSALLILSIFLFQTVTSGDPLDSWTARASNTTKVLMAVAYSGSTFVTVGESGVIRTSPDGTAWSSSSSGTTSLLFDVCYSNGLFVAVGSRGAISTSSSGTTWSMRPSGKTVDLYGVAYGNGLYVVTGYGGAILVSSNGAAWTSRASGTADDLNKIVYANGLFVAVGNNGRILTSPDGAAWTSRTSGTISTLEGVTFGGGLFVAVGYNGVIVTSPDGITWTPRTSGTTKHLSGVAFGAGSFAACGESGTIISSVDAATWTVHASGVTCWLVDILFAQDAFLIAGQGGTVLQSGIPGTPMPPSADAGVDQIANPGSIVSLDGSGSSSPEGSYPLTYSWTISSKPSGSTATLTNPAVVNPSFVPDLVGDYICGLVVVDSTGAVSQSDSIRVRVISPTSDPLDSWTARASNTTKVLMAVAYSGSTFVTVGESGVIRTSPDGTAWSSSSSGTTSLLFDVCYSNGLFVAVGSRGAISTSSSGTTWSMRPSGKTVDLYGVAYGNGLYVVTGYGGAILVSSNGAAWTSRASGTADDLNKIVYANGLFVAVGNNGRILTSPDGAAWTSRTSGTISTLEGVTFGGGLFVAVGYNGVIVTSPDGITWTPRTSGTTKHLSGVAFGAGSFAACGESGTIISSVDAATWTVHASGVTCWLVDILFAQDAFLIAGQGGTVLQSNPLPAPQPPTARSGSDQTATVGALITLDGSGSTGTAPLVYSWIITAKPSGSSTVFTNPTTVMPALTPDVSGDYVIRLVVTDALGRASEPDEMIIHAAPVPHQAQAKLEWDANTEPEVEGYKVHYGINSREYQVHEDVGNVTAHTVTGLNDGVQYFFAATAYGGGMESNFSNEVSFLSAPPCTYGLSPASLSFGADGGTGTSSVSTQNGCTWSASSPVDWASIDVTDGNPGQGRVSCTVGPNATGQARTTSLSVSGQRLLIFQAAQ